MSVLCNDISDAQRNATSLVINDRNPIEMHWPSRAESASRPIPRHEWSGQSIDSGHSMANLVGTGRPNPFGRLLAEPNDHRNSAAIAGSVSALSPSPAPHLVISNQNWNDCLIFFDCGLHLWRNNKLQTQLSYSMIAKVSYIRTQWEWIIRFEFQINFNKISLIFINSEMKFRLILRVESN